MKKNKITFFAMELILLVLALFFVWKIFIQNVPEKRVAVILPESGDQRWDSLIKGMKQSAKENHIHLVICNTDDIENAEAEKETINYTITEDEHTQTGAKIWVVKPEKELSKTDFAEVKRKFATIQGYYSTFKHGFIFKYNPTEALQTG